MLTDDDHVGLDETAIGVKLEEDVDTFGPDEKKLRLDFSITVWLPTYLATRLEEQATELCLPINELPKHLEWNLEPTPEEEDLMTAAIVKGRAGVVLMAKRWAGLDGLDDRSEDADGVGGTRSLWLCLRDDSA